MNALKFGKDESRLYNDICEQVSQYFKTNQVSSRANSEMISKTIILLGTYTLAYLTILTQPISLFAMWLLCLLMGLMVAGIGMGVMHDACHGSYSSNKVINAILGYSLNLVGGNRFNWMIQHNLKHHTYTNIYGADEDLSNGDVIRLSPYSDLRPYHRYQHLYSWFLYMLGTLSWVTIKDFKQFKHLYKEGSYLKEHSLAKEITILVMSKVLYYLYLVIIPYLTLGIPLWQVLVGFVTIHLVAGFVLSVTFQLAHVVEPTAHETSEPQPDLESWVRHQIKTTSNFARKNRFLNWYLGGLNFQIEHHLFPNICHVHYRAISEIVKKTVEDHGLVYNEFKTFQAAVRSHYQTLKLFSTLDQTQVAKAA